MNKLELPGLEPIVKIKAFKDIYCNEKWRMTIAIVEIKGFYKVKIYQFYNDEKKGWKVMKDIAFNNTNQIADVIASLREASEKLEYYVKHKKGNKGEIGICQIKH